MAEQPKLGPSDFRAEAERMLREGTMPSLDDVLKAVSSSREQFADKIRAARSTPEELQNLGKAQTDTLKPAKGETIPDIRPRT